MDSENESSSSSTEESYDNWSLEDALLPNLKGAKSDDGPFPLREKSINYTDSILAWVQTEVQSYGITIEGTKSFGLGTPFLALIHKIDPTLLDYEKFDKSDPIKTLAAAFDIAETAFGIPNLLFPREVIEERETRALLLYLSHFQLKMKEMAKQPDAAAQQNINKLTLMVGSCMNSLGLLKDQFSQDCVVLDCIEGDTKKLEDERTYLINRSKLMDAMVDEAIGMVDSLDQRNDLLAAENQLLQEQINFLSGIIDEEKGRRLRAEDMLKIETTIKAVAGELDTDGHDIEYYIKKFSEPTNSPTSSNDTKANSHRSL